MRRVMFWILSGILCMGALAGYIWTRTPEIARAEPVVSIEPLRAWMFCDAVNALVASVDAYSPDTLPRVTRQRDGAVRFFAPPPGSRAIVGPSATSMRPAAAAAAFLDQYAAAFELYADRTILALDRMTYYAPTTAVRFAQYYDGVPVLGGSIVVHLDESNRVTAVFSDLMQDTRSLDAVPDSATPAFADATARAYAQQWLGPRLDRRIQDRLAQLDDLRAAGAIATADYNTLADEAAAEALDVSAPSRLVILDPAILGKSGPPRLAWEVKGRSAPAGLLSEAVYVDARSAETLHDCPLALHARSRAVYNALGTQSTSSPTYLARSEGDPATNDSDIDGNYDALGAAYDYFQSLFGFDSYDDAGATLQSYVKWGTTGDAAWDADNHYFTFGTGGYATALDIVGHEYTHAVLATLYGPQGGWPLTGEAGAIQESLADMFGEFIENSANDRWLIGNTLSGGAIRDMANPEDYLQPSFLDSSNYYAPEEQYYDAAKEAAINSGIGNKLAYLLTDGADDFRGFTFTGLGKSTVEALYKHAINSLTVDETTTYNDLRDALCASATALYPSDPDVWETVETACDAVDIFGEDNSLPVQKSGVDIAVLCGSLSAGAGTGDGYDYPRDKDIPYKTGPTKVFA